MPKGSVLLAFSGGIDSMFAARRLTGEGYRVTAVTFDLEGDGDMIARARQRASDAGIDWYRADLRERFSREVVDYFTTEYLEGRTPAPCTVCNQRIKWQYLEHSARRNGYDRIATGHYFSIVNSGGNLYVSRAADPRKDQSYYLWMLPQGVLSLALTPMADVIKAEIADPDGRDPKESMGVCFLKGTSCRDYICSRAGDRIIPGEITDRNGNRIGTHDGISYYTVGQKKGLGLPPHLYVTGIDPARNTIIVGEIDDLWHHNLRLERTLITDPADLDQSDITVMIRGFGHNPEGSCRIVDNGPYLDIVTASPCYAPAPGQPVVLYHGDRVIGGGFLKESW